jgi:hypothetical protein
MPKSSYTDDSGELDGKRRRRLFRDLMVFQIKLLIDAFKDVLLSPMAIGAAVMDLLYPRARRGMLFYRLLRAGQAVEERIDLFGTRRRHDTDAAAWTVDGALDQLENRLVSRRGAGGRRAESENPGEQK